MSKEKVHTHYDNLKVARNAPPEVIKAAYRVLCQRYHPDKHPGKSDAHRVMTLVNESYQTLSDPLTRAKHDTWIAEEEARLSKLAVLAELEALQRSASKAAGARNGAAASASESTSKPFRPRPPAEPEVPEPTWPPRQSEKDKEAMYGYSRFTEAQPAHRQHYFQQHPHHQYREWMYPVAALALMGVVFGTMSLVVSTVDGRRATAPVASYNPTSRTPVSAMTPPTRDLPAPVPATALSPPPSGKDPSNEREKQSPLEAQRIESPATSRLDNVTLDMAIDAAAPPHSSVPRYSGDNSPSDSPNTRPTSKPDGASAPNGLPWPTSAGYLAGYDIGALGGLSSIAIDNSRVQTAAHVQLFSVDAQRAVRHAYVPGNAHFTLERVQPGAYEIRFRFLGTQAAYASESIRLHETDSPYGTQYKDVTMTLYQIRGGNMQTRLLPAGAF